MQRGEKYTEERVIPEEEKSVVTFEILRHILHKDTAETGDRSRILKQYVHLPLVPNHEQH